MGGFGGATESLAAGTKRIQERLEGVLAYMTSRMDAAVNGVPDDLAAKARDVMRRGTCVEAKGDEGTIAATCRVMEDEEARDLAKAIFSVFNEACALDAVDRYKRQARPR